MSTTVTEVDDTLLNEGAHQGRFSRVRGDLKLLKWMQGATLASVVALLLRAFTH